MEQQIFLMLLLFTFSMTILSFLIPKNLVIRLFSALLLMASAIVLLGDPFYYYGFGSMNIITSVGSQAGDPGRVGELGLGRIFGGMGVVQLFYASVGFVRYAGEQIRKRGEPNIDKYI